MSCIYIMKRGNRKGLTCNVKTDNVLCSKHKKYLTDEMQTVAKSLRLTKDQLAIHTHPRFKDRRANEIKFCEEYIAELEDDLKKMLDGSLCSIFF